MSTRTESTSAKQNPQFSMHVGSASLLMIFVILCLVSFATLSIVSANADRKLTNKVLERTDAYYDACNEAETELAALDESLENAYASASSETEYYAAAGRGKTFTVSVSDLQMLQVTVEILYPAASGDPYYRITGWQVLTDGESSTGATIIE